MLHRYVDKQNTRDFCGDHLGLKRLQDGKHASDGERDFLRQTREYLEIFLETHPWADIILIHLVSKDEMLIVYAGRMLL